MSPNIYPIADALKMSDKTVQWTHAIDKAKNTAYALSIYVTICFWFLTQTVNAYSTKNTLAMSNLAEIIDR